MREQIVVAPNRVISATIHTKLKEDARLRNIELRHTLVKVYQKVLL